MGHMKNLNVRRMLRNVEAQAKKEQKPAYEARPAFTYKPRKPKATKAK